MGQTIQQRQLAVLAKIAENRCAAKSNIRIDGHAVVGCTQANGHTGAHTDRYNGKLIEWESYVCICGGN